MNLKKIVFYSLIPLSLVVVLALSYSLSILINISKYPYVYDGFQEMMVFSNSPIVSDKSFNEATMRGANDYGKAQYDLYGNDASRVGQANPEEIDNFTAYQNLMDLLYENGAEILVSAGYNVLDSMLGTTIYGADGIHRLDNGEMFNESFKNGNKNGDKKFVIIDDATHSSSINRNVISFRFESEYGGFLAGVSAAVYSTYISSTTDVPNKVSTFGGQNFSTVYDWLSGYEQGIDWFNYEALGYDIYGNQKDKVFNGLTGKTHTPWLKNTSYDSEPVSLINGADGKNYQIDYSSQASDPSSWYTGSFIIGEGTTLSAQQIDAGSQVIFPVAGAQTTDALNQIEIANSSKNQNIKVIGVDSDAAESYPEEAQYILGSGIKKVDKATELGLWYTDRFIDTYNLTYDSNFNDYDKDMYSLMTHTPEGYNILTGKIDVDENEDPISGWVEYNEAYTSRDFATMSDKDVEKYFEDADLTPEGYPNDGAAYVENKDANFYTSYGTQYKSDDGIYSSEFVGNYDNGGVDFNGSASLDQAFNSMRDAAINAGNLDDSYKDSTINSFYDEAIAENLVIETSSDTFADAPAKTSSLTVQEEQDWYDNVINLWMPDWSKY